MAVKSPPEVLQAATQARSSLQRLGLPAQQCLFKPSPGREDAVPTWTIRNVNPIRPMTLRSLPGTWEIYAAWTLQPLLDSKTLALMRSSIGLNVSGLEAPALADKVCLVRYDVDTTKTVDGPDGSPRPIGRHLNVLQPGPLSDKLHLPYIPHSLEPWPVDETVRLLSAPSLVAELARLVR